MRGSRAPRYRTPRGAPSRPRRQPCATRIRSGVQTKEVRRVRRASDARRRWRRTGTCAQRSSPRSSTSSPSGLPPASRSCRSRRAATRASRARRAARARALGACGRDASRAVRWPRARALRLLFLGRRAAGVRALGVRRGARVRAPAPRRQRRGARALLQASARRAVGRQAARVESHAVRADHGHRLRRAGSRASRRRSIVANFVSACCACFAPPARAHA